MLIHTNTITAGQLYSTLAGLETLNLVTANLHFEVLTEHGSRKRDHAFEIQLGACDKVKGDKRGWKNSGTNGAGDVYAATYDEWGYFLAALYHLDKSTWCQCHGDLDGFRENTEGHRLNSRQEVFDYMAPTELMHELLNA